MGLDFLRNGSDPFEILAEFLPMFSNGSLQCRERVYGTAIFSPDAAGIGKAFRLAHCRDFHFAFQRKNALLRFQNGNRRRFQSVAGRKFPEAI